MNERIQELALQAGAGEWGDSVIPAMMDIEKFAELIVQECATLIPAEQSHAPNGQSLLKIFEEHFGVK